MDTRLSISRVGQALGLLFAALYGLCVAWDALFPAEAMRSVWGNLLPGWDWLGVGNFFIGLGEVYLYGWIVALLFVPIWHAAGALEKERPQRRAAPAGPAGTAHAH